MCSCSVYSNLNNQELGAIFCNFKVDRKKCISLLRKTMTSEQFNLSLIWGQCDPGSHSLVIGQKCKQMPHAGQIMDFSLQDNQLIFFV